MTLYISLFQVTIDNKKWGQNIKDIPTKNDGMQTPSQSIIPSKITDYINEETAGVSINNRTEFGMKDNQGTSLIQRSS